MMLLKTFSLVTVLVALPCIHATKTFKVCDVKKGNRRFSSLEMEMASKLIKESFNNNGQNPGKKLEYEIGNINQHLVDPDFGFKNAFIATALTAYNNHLPLELSPDDIWTLISYGVAQHLGGDNNTAEYYRKVFVNHEGKKELSVRGEPYGLQPGNPAANRRAWPGIIAALSKQIKNNTKTDVSEIMTNPFTTTGQVEQTVFHCMLMDTMKNYFSYKVVMLCGIPDITLHGTVEDWRSIVTRLDKLMGIFPDFEWYLNKIKTHVLKMIATLDGNQVDLDFWNTMILDEPLGSGGGRKFSGWLGDFFPYQYVRRQKQKNLGKKSLFTIFTLLINQELINKTF